MNPRNKTIAVVQGDFVVSSDPDVTLSTVLGSCVAVCLFDKGQKIGGMNHFLLADTGNGNSTDLKYGVNAMELLINKLLQSGAERTRLQAKVFGGARMTNHARDIGGSNSEFALKFLNREGIPSVSQSTGGSSARRVHFHPATGAAKQIRFNGPDPVPMVRKVPVEQDITLF